MTLEKREKTLAAVTAVLVLVVVGNFLFSMWRAPRTALRAEYQSLVAQVEKKEEQLKKSKAAQVRLAEWNRRALPSDPEMASTQYAAWLTKLAEEEVGFSGTNVDTAEGPQRSGIYHGLRFIVNAQGTLEQLIEFLFKFDSAGHLHQIRTLSADPIQGTPNLKLGITIEALSLPGATSPDQLSSEASNRLAYSDLDEYQKKITGRNLFAAYRPPPPVREEIEPPPFDPTKFAYLSGIVGENGELQAWLVERTSGKVSELREGDTFEVGELRGKIIQIRRRNAEIEINGERWLYPFGDNLGAIVKLPGAESQ